ncbi:hypothetical protein Ocin01_14256 [Orchesella cincta]|uniref:Uncharacterized protein n=1 Tax=Orchesella cincta TaxID=48709 RepID=A0A1D2MHE2_ORCCI|nr:hypothetical protein Ocin01_14256 [Orchesella cincta]
MFSPDDSRFIIQFGTPGHYEVNLTFNFGVQANPGSFQTQAPVGHGNFYGITPIYPENHPYPPQMQMQQYGNGHCAYMRALPPACYDFSSSSFEASTSSNAPGTTSNSWQYVPPPGLQTGYGTPQTPYNNNYPNAFYNGGKPFQPSPTVSSSTPSFGEKTFMNSTSTISDSPQGGCFSSKKCNIV